MRIRQGSLPRALVSVLAAGIVLAVVLWFFAALNNLNHEQGDEGRQQLETALRRASVACYASEGIYPPTLDYLTAHYGVQIETDKYLVFYDVFACNLMPDITVLEKDSR